MKKSIIHLLISIVFVAFAVMQFNDPDSLIWVGLYLIVAVVAFLAWKEKYYRMIYLGLLAILILWWASYLPEFAQWVRDGMPNIAASMKAESPYIELVREFFGLFISIIFISFYYIQSKKLSK